MRVYKHSGVVPAGSAIFVAMSSIVVAMLLGVAYAYLVRYVPFVQLRGMITLLFGIFLAASIERLATFGKIRNRWFVIGLGLMASIVGIYVSWGAWIVALEGFENVGFGPFLPGIIFEYATIVYENGLWNIGNGGPLKGLPLALVWLIEAGVIIACPIYYNVKNYGQNPFCEKCENWTTTEKSVQCLCADGTEPCWSHVMNGELIALNEVMEGVGDELTLARLDVSRCQNCDGDQYLTVRIVEKTIDKDGKVAPKEKVLIHNLIISAREAEFVRICGTPNPDLEPSPGESPSSEEIAPPTDA